jgi:hypothetical protein
MVCRRMGLLDDAIRDHLELKRRRGADPGEVAREQHEALEPIIPRDHSPSNGDAESPSEPATEDSGESDGPRAQAAADLDHADAPLPDATGDDGQERPDPTGLGQETAELDMQSVLHDDHGEAHPPEDRHDQDDSRLGEQAADPHAEIPGQERLTFE